MLCYVIRHSGHGRAVPEILEHSRTLGPKIFAFIRRCIRTGFCSPDLADFHELYISSDEKLFNKILTCPNHILRTLLSPPILHKISLKNRPHNRQLPDRISRITDCNFTVRMLYRNMYWLLYILDLRFVLFLYTTSVWQFAINEYVMLWRWRFCLVDVRTPRGHVHGKRLSHESELH